MIYVHHYIVFKFFYCFYCFLLFFYFYIFAFFGVHVCSFVMYGLLLPCYIFNNISFMYMNVIHYNALL